jgi:hypothetical protein
VRYVDESSGESRGLRVLLGNDGPDRRMVDAEVMLRIIGLFTNGSQYGGNLKDFLDQTCKNYNLEWTTREAEIVNLVEEMEQAIETLVQIFGQSRACKRDCRANAGKSLGGECLGSNRVSCSIALSRHMRGDTSSYDGGGGLTAVVGTGLRRVRSCRPKVEERPRCSVEWCSVDRRGAEERAGRGTGWGPHGSRGRRV